MTPDRLRRLAGVALALALPLAAACGDEGPAPEPGALTFVLRSPHGAEGGAVILVPDEVVTQATTDDGMLALRQTGEGTRLVVVRATPGEIRFRVTVEDIHRPPSLVVEQVSGADDRLRASLDGYAVEARP